MTSPFRTPMPRLMHVARLIIKKKYNDFFSLYTSYNNVFNRKPMHACARTPMLWSKDVLDGIVLWALCNLERFRPQLLQKRDNVIYWINLHLVDDIVGFPHTY